MSVHIHRVTVCLNHKGPSRDRQSDYKCSRRAGTECHPALRELLLTFTEAQGSQGNQGISDRKWRE